LVFFLHFDHQQGWLFVTLERVDIGGVLFLQSFFHRAVTFSDVKIVKCFKHPKRSNSAGNDVVVGCFTMFVNNVQEPYAQATSNMVKKHAGHLLVGKVYFFAVFQVHNHGVVRVFKMKKNKKAPLLE
jgi:hypothetical protein